MAPEAFGQPEITRENKRKVCLADYETREKETFDTKRK